MTKKISTPIALAIVVILAVIVGGGILLLSQKLEIEPLGVLITESTPIPTPSGVYSNNVNGLTTYQDTKYGFSISYPDSWSIEGRNNKFFIFCSDEGLNTCSGLGDSPGAGLEIKYEEISLEDFVKGYSTETDHYSYTDNIIKQEKYIIGSIEGVKMTATTGLGSNETIIFINRDNKSYIISFFENAKEAQYKIISTFKFIN